jgi:gamma-glutamyltranspeptidase
MRFLIIALILTCLISCQPQNPASQKEPILGPIAARAMVTSAHPIATKVGVQTRQDQ